MSRAYVTTETGPTLDRAWQLYRWRRYPLALAEAQKYLAARPDSADAHALIALCHGSEKRKVEAYTAAAAAVRLAPDRSYPHYILALVYYWFDQYEPAKKALKETLRLDPSDPDVYELLASVHSCQGHFQAAQEVANAGLALDAAHAGCLFQRAHAIRGQGKADDAERGFLDVLRLNPEHALAQGSLGYLAVQRGEYARAIPLLRHALREHAQLDFLQKAWHQALAGRYTIYRLVGLLKHKLFDKHFVAVGCFVLFLWAFGVVYIYIVNNWPGPHLFAWIVLAFMATILTLSLIYLAITLIQGLTSRVVLMFDRRKPPP